MNKKWIAGFLVLALLLIGGFVAMAISSFKGNPVPDKGQEETSESDRATKKSEQKYANKGGSQDSKSPSPGETSNKTDGVYGKDLVLEGKGLTETEWSLLKGNVLRLVEESAVKEAIELLAEATYGIDREELSFKDELFYLEQDITIYATIAERTGKGTGDMIQSEVAVDLARTMRDPRLALLTLFSMPHKERVEVLLHQQSLAPLFEGEPVYGAESEYEGEFLNDIRMFYGKDAEVRSLDVTLEEQLLHAIVVKADGSWKVWRLIEAEGVETNYQSVEYWKEFFSKTNKVRKGE